MEIWVGFFCQKSGWEHLVCNGGNWSRISSRFLGAVTELGPHRSLDLLPGNCFLLVHSEAPKAEQPHSHGVRWQHYQQRKGAAESDQKPHRETRSKYRSN